MNFSRSPQHPTFKKLQITLSYHSKSKNGIQTSSGSLLQYIKKLVTAGELKKEGAA